MYNIHCIIIQQYINIYIRIFTKKKMHLLAAAAAAAIEVIIYEKKEEKVIYLEWVFVVYAATFLKCT